MDSGLIRAVTPYRPKINPERLFYIPQSPKGITGVTKSKLQNVIKIIDGPLAR